MQVKITNADVNTTQLSHSSHCVSICSNVGGGFGLRLNILTNLVFQRMNFARGVHRLCLIPAT
jgi:protein subunit release factor A